MDKDNINLKDLWKKQPVSTPDIKEIQAKVSAYKKENYRHMIKAYSSQIIPFIAGILVWIYLPILPITKLGLVLMFTGILYFLAQYNSYYSTIKKLDMNTSNKDYLQSLVAIQEKQRTLQTRTLSIFFIVLIIALHFYLYYPLSLMPLPYAILAYAATFLWVAFSWFYLRPRTIKKNEAKINELIDHYKGLEGQI